MPHGPNRNRRRSSPGAGLRRWIVAALLSLLSPLSLLGPAGFAAADGDPEATLRIVGSDSMAPFLREIETAMAAAAGGAASIEIEGRGSSTGPPALLRGEAGIASLTRPLSAAEHKAFRARYGRDPLAFAIALDAVAVFVNAGNPLERMTLEQIDAVFSADRRCADQPAITRWGDLQMPAVWAERSIGVYTTPSSSGTRALFRDVALCGGRIRETARQQPGTRSLALAVGESRYAIGFGTLAGASAETRALALPARDGDGFATTDPADVRSGRYPFTRELLLYVMPDENGKLSQPVVDFLRVALSDAGQRIVQGAGFLRLDAHRAHEQASQLE